MLTVDAFPYIDIRSAIFWLNNEGQYHRSDGPAIEEADGNMFWCQHGLLHRIDAPAVEFADGDSEWWENGHQIRSQLRALVGVLETGGR